ncbi:MAG: EF-hand domain-containing protein [Planctomycetota bacterium]
MAVLGCSGGYQAAEERLRAEALRRHDDEMARYEAEAARLRAEIFQRFDRNKDGTLNRQEDEAYEAYVAKVRSGQTANPFEAIVSPGIEPR